MKKNILAILLSLGALYTSAQESVNATGGVVTGTTGTSSYSIGQIVYTTTSESDGSIAQGIQQPFEIFTITGINKKSINLELSIYPNPTTDYLTLSIKDFEHENLSAQLFDMQGRLLRNKTILSLHTTIEMTDLEASTYFIKINNKKEIIKTFKIIKN